MDVSVNQADLHVDSDGQARPRQPRVWRAPKFFVETIKGGTALVPGTGSDVNSYTQKLS